MTYSAIEISIRSGSPIELYEFSIGSVYYRYTNYDEDVTIGANTYTAIPIHRSKILKIEEINKSNLDISLPLSNEVAEFFIGYPPSAVVLLQVKSYHINDISQEIITLWAGRVLSCIRDKSKSTLKCESVFTSIQRIGLLRNYQAMCPHRLYGTKCGVLKSNYEYQSVVTAVNESVITGGYSLQANGYYSGGLAIFTSTALTESRLIVDHVGDDITLNYPIPDLSASNILAVYPGCNRTLDQCDTRFSNSDNYGGFPYLPTLNPFNGTTLF